MILKYDNKWHSYGPDKLIYGHFWPLNSKCDLDNMVVIISRDTPSNDGEQMCQMILKYDNKWHSYGPDKLIYGHFWPLNSKCDVDLGDIDVIISRHTPSNYGEQMCQMILKSDNERHSYGPDKLVSPARQPASPPAFANLITSFFLQKTWLKIVIMKNIITHKLDSYDLLKNSKAVLSEVTN